MIKLKRFAVQYSCGAVTSVDAPSKAKAAEIAKATMPEGYGKVKRVVVIDAFGEWSRKLR